MRLKTNQTNSTTYFYIIKDYKNNGKRTTKIVEKLGNLDEVKQKSNGKDPFIWAKEYIEQLNHLDK
jgi:hypothetical protein